MDLDQLKYPIGGFRFPKEFTEEQVTDWVNEVELLPQNLAKELSGVGYDQLKWKYRPDGWNIQQVVHHFADSHMNAYIRCKLVLTEDSPEVKPYREDAWAELPDSAGFPIEASLDIIGGVHLRWVHTLKSLNPGDLQKTYYHSEYQKTYQLGQVMALYAWHCQHHLAHIQQAKEATGSYNRSSCRGCQ